MGNDKKSHRKGGDICIYRSHTMGGDIILKGLHLKMHKEFLQINEKTTQLFLNQQEISTGKLQKRKIKRPRTTQEGAQDHSSPGRCTLQTRWNCPTATSRLRPEADDTEGSGRRAERRALTRCCCCCARPYNCLGRPDLGW